MHTFASSILEVCRIAVELISEQTLVVRYHFCELQCERKNVGAACFSSEISVRLIKLQSINHHL